MNRLIEIIGSEEVLKFDKTTLPLLIGMDATAHVRLDGDGASSLTLPSPATISFCSLRTVPHPVLFITMMNR